MKVIILCMILVLAGCDDTDYPARNQERYNLLKELCPNEYTIELYSQTNYDHRYQCCKPTQNKKDCIKETTGYFKELHGEFEDWDTSDIPDIIDKCNSRTCLRF